MSNANLLENIINQDTPPKEDNVVENTPEVKDTTPSVPPVPPTPTELTQDMSDQNIKVEETEEPKDTSILDDKLNLDTDKIKKFALNFIVPLISLGVSILLLLIIVIPSFRNKPAVETELNQKQTLNTTLTKKESNLERLVDFKSVVDENSELIDKVLVSEEMVPELLSEVDYIAKEAGMEVTRLSYSLSQAQSGDEGFPAVDISLGVRGTYDQFVNFLKLIENAARLVDMSNFRYSIGSKDDTGLNFNIVLVSPYLFVDSSAVTDDMVDLDITSGEFLAFINKLKSLKYYDPEELPQIEEVVETTPEEELPSEETDIVTTEENIPSEVTLIQ